MGKRPSFQFYPADWRNNANLSRCSHDARGAWIDVMCVLHDSDEYGLVRWPLDELARAAAAPRPLLDELARKKVLKGCDRGKCEPLNYTPRSGRKNGPTVTLLAKQDGPIWYSSRMLRDEYIRKNIGASSRFRSAPTQRGGEDNGSPSHSPIQRSSDGQDAENNAPGHSPSNAPSRAPSARRSDGSSSSSSSSSFSKKKSTPFPTAPGPENPEDDTPAELGTPSGGTLQVGDPPHTTVSNSRAEGTNPRTRGTNQRSLGTNPKTVVKRILETNQRTIAANIARHLATEGREIPAIAKPPELIGHAERVRQLTEQANKEIEIEQGRRVPDNPEPDATGVPAANRNET